MLAELIVMWVHLCDKGPIDVAAGVAALEHTYDERAVERRRLRRTAPGLFDERDLPVHGAYVDAIEATGADLRVHSRWLNAVSVEATAAQLAAIDALPFVESTHAVRRTRHGDLTRHDDLPGGAATSFYGISGPQLGQINLVAYHEAGHTAAGVRIGILDTGFNRSHLAFNHPDLPLDVVAEFDFVNDDANTAPQPGDLANQHHHGTYILGTIAAYQPGAIVGGAFDASVILAKVEDLAGEYAAEEDYFVAGLEFIEAHGGDVATSSVVIFDHYEPEELDGQTTVMTIGFNIAAENGLHCFQGVGNNGHDDDPETFTLVPPADALRVISVGAVDSIGTIAGFSSDGPTADGRLKPEVLARGLATWTVNPDVDDLSQAVSGTSLSTPLLASAAACLVKQHPDWTVDQLRSALFQTADQYTTNGEPDPLFVHGFGLIDVVKASLTTPSVADLDGDFAVDVDDLVMLLLAWGPCRCPEDLDGDGQVGVTDLVILISNWG